MTGIRFARYDNTVHTATGTSSSDFDNTSYKFGADWSPVEDLRFNVMFQRAVRAPNLREITRLTAELGGFLGRKGDGEPGSITLWRGLQRLHDIASAFLIFKQHHSIQHPAPSKRPVPSQGDYG